MDIGGISIHEMENMARNMTGNSFSISKDVGNVIEVSDFGGGDDLGLNMLANPIKIGGGSSQGKSGGGISWATENGTNSHKININPGGGGIGDIELTNMESMGGVTFDMGKSEVSFGKSEGAFGKSEGAFGKSEGAFGKSDSSRSSMQSPIQIDFNKSDSDSKSSLYFNDQTASGPSLGFSPVSSAPVVDVEKEKKDKIEILNKLNRLEQKGFQVSRRFTMDNSLDEIKMEFDRLVDARNLEASLRFQRQALMGVVTGMEWLNTRFDPFDIKLDGWSESVHENVEDFDEIFEELYDKYKERGNMPPEARLMFALAGSGFMCHISNTFLRSKMPSMDDIMKKNPDLARQMAGAAASAAGPGFGNFMNMAMGGGAAPAAATQGPGAFFGAADAPPPLNSPQPMASVEPKTARKEMRGPVGVDVNDILKTFDDARAQQKQNTYMPQPEFSDNGMRDALQMPTSQPAVMAAVEMQSLASDDIGSTTESARAGGRGRRRKAAVGNTLSLNV
jgi:hypothetical protein